MVRPVSSTAVEDIVLAICSVNILMYLTGFRYQVFSDPLVWKLLKHRRLDFRIPRTTVACCSIRSSALYMLSLESYPLSGRNDVVVFSSSCRWWVRILSLLYT